MEENSSYGFFDSPTSSEKSTEENLEGLSTEEKASDPNNTDAQSTDSDNPTVKVVELGETPASSSLDLLKDYVIVQVLGPESGFQRTDTPYPIPVEKLLGTPLVRVEVKYDYGLINLKTSDDEETMEKNDHDGGIRESAKVTRTRHVYIPQASYHSISESTISCYQDNNADSADEESASDNQDDENNLDQQVEGEEYDEEEYESDDDSYTDGNPPNEGMISPARTQGSRLSTINSNLYKTDGEDLNDITISRSFAKTHRQEIVEAGAKTIGELFVSLKRKKAQEMADNADEDAGTSSSHIINKRKDENGKLKYKGKEKLPKSTIPFEEKQQSKARQKSAVDDNKVTKGKTRSSQQSSATLNSDIHVQPEVRGDMGTPRVRAAIATNDSAESLTPESLTRLCDTETGHRSSARNKSINSQLMSDVDSRTGYISGRKNPRAKAKAGIHEAGKSRIPLPVNRPGPHRKTLLLKNTEQGTNKPSTSVKNWTSNSASDKTRSTRESSFKTHVIQLANPELVIRKNTPCVTVRKPPIPYQMKSVACYHNGKLDVSILGDKKLLANTDPLNVQITLLPQIKDDTRMTRTHELSPLKNKPRTAGLNSKTSDVKCGETGRKNNTQSQDTTNDPMIKPKKITARKRDKNSKQLPPLKNVSNRYLLNKGNHFRSWAPPKSRMEFKNRRDRVAKVSRPLSPVDWDIVNHRAQLPPFNTYTDPEASVRFQKVWCSY